MAQVWQGATVDADPTVALGVASKQYVDAETTRAEAAEALLAPKASPTLTGTTTVARIVSTPVALTFATTLATDASLGNYFRTTLTASFTLANPTNPTDGQKVIWELLQDATGGRVMTLGSAFALGTDITSTVATLTTSANKRDFVGAVYNSATSKWYIVAVSRGY